MLFKRNHTLDAATSGGNITYFLDEEGDNEYLYDRADVRAICIILYSIVFIACFFGNLIVILVVTVHYKMRSITNFCLANLAFADFCVSIFCVYQNMYIYFMSSWVFGAFMCKMYYFITELSHTASILILVVICIERYLAIVHPMRCKEWLTLARLRLTIIGVWGTSAVYSSPRLYYTNIGKMYVEGKEEILCIPIRTLYDSETFDMISLILLFIFPLLVITILYTRIGLALWESSKTKMPPHPLIQSTGPGGPESCSSSDHNCDGVNHPSFPRHSCTEILCCGCHPCRPPFCRKSPPKELNHHSIGRDGNYGGSGRSNNSLVLGSDNHNIRGQSPTTHAHTHQPMTIDCNDHIVVVKFETTEKRMGKKLRGNKCTILFNGTATFEKRGEVAVAENCGQINPSGIGGRNSPRPAANPIGTGKLKRMTVTRGGKYGGRALAARRGIIKMLIIIVFAFAICNLPFHARKIWQNYGSGYSGGSTFSSIFTPVTFLIMYSNSGINPFLYAFMSKKFRLCFMDLLNCKLRRSLCVARNASVRSTHLIPLSTPPA